MMDRFSLEVETIYYNDPGTQSNVFNLSAEDLKNRIVDVMDFVKVSAFSLGGKGRRLDCSPSSLSPSIRIFV